MPTLVVLWLMDTGTSGQPAQWVNSTVCETVSFLNPKWKFGGYAKFSNQRRPCWTPHMFNVHCWLTAGCTSALSSVPAMYHWRNLFRQSAPIIVAPSTELCDVNWVSCNMFQLLNHGMVVIWPMDMCTSCQPSQWVNSVVCEAVSLTLSVHTVL